jgi:hypothetical protein
MKRKPVTKTVSTANNLAKKVVFTEPKMMICPKAKKCIWKVECPCGITPHQDTGNCNDIKFDCPACVPVKAKKRKGRKTNEPER